MPKTTKASIHSLAAIELRLLAKLPCAAKDLTVAERGRLRPMEQARLIRYDGEVWSKNWCVNDGRDSDGRECCTHCAQPIAFTSDWTRWPWADGAGLCSDCNDQRHDVDDYDEVTNKAARRG